MKALAVWMVLAGLPVLSGAACPPQVVDASTLDHKLMMGYQGWFGAPGDGSPDSAWFHWFRDASADMASATFDLYPDVSELGPKELFATNMTGPDGRPMSLYSAYEWTTVARHFKWMRDYGIDGVMLQRFASELSNPRLFRFRNQVTVYVKAASQYYGRVYCVMYDISGDAHFDDTVMRDWKYMVDTLKVTDSPRYLRHRGKPLVAIWGIGFADRPQTPEQVARLLDFFKNSPNPAYRATVMGGVPLEWRQRQGASRPEAAWADIYRSLDVISPWTVGSYHDAQSADAYRQQFLMKDLWATHRSGQDYMPVVWPGFSWHNLNQGALNQIPRLGGTFYWRQVYNALDQGCDMIYNAMFDEVDEGTAMYKILPSKAQLPPAATFLTLDADGYQLPSDWYLRLAGMADRTVRGDLPLSDGMPINPRDPKSSDAVFQCR